MNERYDDCIEPNVRLNFEVTQLNNVACSLIKLSVLVCLYDYTHSYAMCECLQVANCVRLM